MGDDKRLVRYIWAPSTTLHPGCDYTGIFGVENYSISFKMINPLWDDQ